MEAAAAIELQGIQKSFGNVHAVRGVSLRIEKGAITGIVGTQDHAHTVIDVGPLRVVVRSVDRRCSGVRATMQDNRENGETWKTMHRCIRRQRRR